MWNKVTTVVELNKNLFNKWNLKQRETTEKIIIYMYWQQQNTWNTEGLTLNLLSCNTFLMATSSPESQSLAWYTTPNDPFPITLVSV